MNYYQIRMQKIENEIYDAVMATKGNDEKIGRIAQYFYEQYPLCPQEIEEFVMNAVCKVQNQ